MFTAFRRSNLAASSTSASSLLCCGSTSSSISFLVSTTRTKVHNSSSAWVSDLDWLLKKRDRERKQFDEMSKRPDLPKQEQEKMKKISELMEKDEEALELKRIHSLSMERIQDHQRRNMQTAEEKGIYVEDSINKQVLDAFSNTEYNKKKVKSHLDQARKNRYFFIFLKFVATMSLWWVIHWYYASDPMLVWVDKPGRLYFTPIRTRDVGAHPRDEQS